MQLQQLQKQIIEKKLAPCYILFGEEVGIMDIYLEKITTVTNSQVTRLDSIQEAFSKINQRTMSRASRCFIVRDDKEFFKNEKIWETVFQRVKTSGDYLLIIYSTVDKRSKFYKQYVDDMVEFEKLTADQLVKYVSKELPTLLVYKQKELAEICECNYSRILLECDKVRQYAEATATLQETTESYDTLIEQGIIYQPIGDITFKFTDAILMRNKADTAEYMLQAKLKQEPEIMILSILYNGFKQILMVQGLGADQSEPSKRTGLTPWQVKLAKEKQGHYNIGELINAIKVIQFAEMSIKTGQLDADIALDYVICNIM